MTAWIDRPPIVAAMLNPALLAAILATAANGYRKESDHALPWALSFIIAPLVLHRGTRQALPTSTRTRRAGPGRHTVWPRPRNTRSGGRRFVRKDASTEGISDA